MNSLAVFAFAFVYLQLVCIGAVHGKPTWIPSNVTFVRVNETHLQVMYREKHIEMINLEQYRDKAPKQTSNQSSVADSRPDKLDPLTSAQYERLWARVNLCYFNPVTCFIGERN